MVALQAQHISMKRGLKGSTLTRFFSPSPPSLNEKRIESLDSKRFLISSLSFTQWKEDWKLSAPLHRMTFFHLPSMKRGLKVAFVGCCYFYQQSSMKRGLKVSPFVYSMGYNVSMLNEKRIERCLLVLVVRSFSLLTQWKEDWKETQITLSSRPT